MVDGNAGKGGRYRKVDPKKFGEGYERIWGKKMIIDYHCNNCESTFDELAIKFTAEGNSEVCPYCESENYVKRAIPEIKND